MTGRSPAASRKAGAKFERDVADYLAEHVDDRIDRRVKTGSKDKGDIAGLRHMGQRVVIEAKNQRRLDLADWIKQADIERGNDDAQIGLVIHKRHGAGDTGDQYVTCTLRDLVALLTGERPDYPTAPTTGDPS